MLQIGICDDMLPLAESLQEKLLNNEYTKIPYEITIYTSALQIIEEKPKLDLLFLDIEMPGMTGVELMRNHADLLADTKVAFLTGYDYFAPECYEVNAFRYLLKPAKDDKLKELFQAIEREMKLERLLPLHTEGHDIEVPLKNIMYIESYKNYLHVHTTNAMLKCRGSMGEILNDLPEEYFYPLHKSYIINWKHVKDTDLNKHKVTMSNDTILHSAFRKRDEFVKAYFRQLHGR